MSFDDAKINFDGEIKKIEEEMNLPNFWSDKEKAQTKLRELADLKAKKGGVDRYERGNAVIAVISGAGGDDAEDFSRMLFEMYSKYAKKMGWEIYLINEHQNDHGGYRNISFEISGRNVYGTLKNESGVHRLVRVSPFNAKKLRHTSFSLVEVLPKFSELEEKSILLRPEDLKIEFSRSSGPGGQNVNKRETAVRVVHTPTNISAHVSTERSQEQNKQTALSIIRAKIFKKAEEEQRSIEESMKMTKDTEIEWGNQIRSYVLHPYKMVKDHRTDIETSDVDGVLDGDLDIFIEAKEKLC
jgi:peptide chain release factor 2